MELNEISLPSSSPLNKKLPGDVSIDSNILLEGKFHEKENEDSFKTKLDLILERIRNLPDTVEELPPPTVKRNVIEVYSKLCEVLKIPEDSEFVSNINGEKMDFSCHSLGTLGIIAVSKALVYCQSVKELNLSFNKLGVKRLPTITSMLNQNEFITHLNLSNNQIGKNSATQLGALVSVCYSVIVLDLSGNNLGDDEFAAIGTSMAEINAIKTLNLSRNDIGVISGALFGSCIAKCSKLEELDLSSNHLENGAIGIFTNLKNSNVRILNVSKNGVPDDAMQALVHGLRGSKTLQELDISDNFISNIGVAILASGVKGSYSLEILKLDYNPFQGKVANSLLSAAGNNLKLLDLTGIKVTLPFIKTYTNYVSAGRELKVLFGSEIRSECLSWTQFIPQEGDAITESNALWAAQKVADSKGVSLRNVLKTIHAAFLAEKAVARAEKEDESVDDEAKDKEREQKMSIKDFVKGLMDSELGVKKAVAQELAASLADEEGFLDMWTIISKIPYRPDYIAVKEKKKEPKKEKSKGKGKEKGKGKKKK